MEIVQKIFYWLEKIGGYGSAITRISHVAKEELQKIHPEIFKSTENYENGHTDTSSH